MPFPSSNPSSSPASHPPAALRLFFALAPSTAQCQALVEQVTPLVSHLGAQPVPAENLHLTLCFLGAVASDRLEELKTLAAHIQARRAELRFEALEFWSGPQVLCATAPQDAASEPLRDLARRLAASAIAAGFSPDVKNFRAHLTLARKVTTARAASCAWPRALVPPLTMRCDRFMLMVSRRRESGSVYSVVDSWTLDADKSV